MREMWMVVVAVALSSCSGRDQCATGDLDCVAESFSINDFSTFDDASKRDKLTLLSAALPAIADSPKLSLSEQGALVFPNAEDGQLILLSWRDENGCRPSFCMNHCPRGVRCVTRARCTPSRRDGLTQATTSHWVEYGKDPSADEDFDLVVTPVSAANCPTDVAALIDAGDASVAFGAPVTIEVHLPGPGGGGGPGSGSDRCFPDLNVSTLNCTPIGSGGVGDYCLSDAEYRGIFGSARPSACAPTGTTGCMDTQKGALVQPCCPGHTCRVGSACGGGSVLGGVCD